MLTTSFQRNTTLVSNVVETQKALHSNDSAAPSNQPTIPTQVPHLCGKTPFDVSDQEDQINIQKATDDCSKWDSRLSAAKRIQNTVLQQDILRYLLKNGLLASEKKEVVEAMTNAAQQQDGWYYLATQPNSISTADRKEIISKITDPDKKIAAWVSVGLNPLAAIQNRYEAANELHDCIRNLIYKGERLQEMITQRQNILYSIALGAVENKFLSNNQKPYRYLAAERIYNSTKQQEAFYTLAVDTSVASPYRIEAAQRLTHYSTQRKEAFKIAAKDRTFYKYARWGFVYEVEISEQEAIWLYLAKDPSMGEDLCLRALKHIKDEAKQQEALYAIAVNFSLLDLAKKIKDAHQQQAAFYAIGMQAGGRGAIRYSAAGSCKEESQRQEIYYAIAMDPRVDLIRWSPADWRLQSALAIQGEDKEAKILSIVYNQALDKDFRISVVNALFKDASGKEQLISDINNGVVRSGRLTKAAKKGD